MTLSLIALMCGFVAPVAAITVKLRRPPRRLASYRKMLLPQQPMLRLVHLETARAERNGLPLTLVVFPISSAALAADTELLEERLAEKTRLSDASGWLSDHELAVLLPETTAAGARSFISQLRKLCDKRFALPAYTIWKFEGKWVAETETARPAEAPRLAMSA